MKDLKSLTKKMLEIDVSEIKDKIVDKAKIESVVGVSEKIREKVESSSLKEKMHDVTEKIKVGSVVDDLQKGISKISLRDKSILAPRPAQENTLKLENS